MGEPCNAQADPDGHRFTAFLLPIYLIGGTSPRAIAAVLVVDDLGSVCWYNRRLVHSAQLCYVDLWARYAAAHGRRYDTLSEDDLECLA